jgi:hypothetical protein
MAGQPLRVSMLITADASGVSAATGEARREVQSLGVTARGSAAGLGTLAAANDQAAAAAQRAAQAAIGQSQAETQLQRTINAAVGVRAESSGSDYARRQADIEAFGASLDQLRAKYNPVYAASQAYERELTELNRALALGAINAQEHGAALTALNGRYTAAAGAAAVYGESAGLARMQTSNLAFQIQDIGTMLAAGQNPFMLLAQQLPQVTMHGGQVNGIMGALRQTVAGLFSPLGLVTTGFVLAASAAISYFADVEDESANAELTLDEQRSLIRQVADEWGGLVPALAAYAEELERVDKSGKLLQATQHAINKEFQDAQPAIDAAKTEILQFSARMNGIGENAEALSRLRGDFAEFRDASEALNTVLREGGDATAAQERFSRSLAAVIGNEAVSAQDSLEAAIRRVEQAFRDAAGAGAQLAQQTAAAKLGERELGLLGTVPPVFSGGGGFIDANELQTQRANATKSEYQIEQERLARRRPRKTDAERDAERYDQIVAQAERAIEMEMLEAQALTMTGEAADRLRITQELLNQARAAGIELGPEQVAELTALGAAMAQVTAETQAQADAMGLRRDVMTDVIGGIRQAAEDGKITLEELGDISLRVLDRIIDKIQGDFIDALLNLGGAGGGSGIFGAIGQLFGFGGGNLALPASGPIPTARPGFSEGGFTGWGNPRRVAGDVHEEEYVFSAAATRTIGVGNLERMHQRAKAGRGFAEGGYTGGAAGGVMVDAGGGRVHLTFGLASDGALNIMPEIRQVSRSEANGVLFEAGPQLVNAATQSTMSSIARGDADDTMSSRFGVEARARRLG